MPKDNLVARAHAVAVDSVATYHVLSSYSSYLKECMFAATHMLDTLVEAEEDLQFSGESAASLRKAVNHDRDAFKQRLMYIHDRMDDTLDTISTMRKGLND